MIKFTHSVIGRNTKENRESCEKLGCTYSYETKNDKREFIGVKDGVIYYFSSFSLALLGLPNAIVCTHSDELFRAVSAIREDSDYMQWFTDGESWFLCKEQTVEKHIREHMDGWDCEGMIKATLEELKEKFK